MALPTSPDTILRRVKDGPDSPSPPPRYVGLDDWACRKGQSYGTILIDLKRRCVIDILPDRDGEAVKQWLAANPQVEVITRDRWPRPLRSWQVYLGRPNRQVASQGDEDASPQMIGVEFAGAGSATFHRTLVVRSHSLDSFFSVDTPCLVGPR